MLVYAFRSLCQKDQNILKLYIGSFDITSKPFRNKLYCACATNRTSAESDPRSGRRSTNRAHGSIECVMEAIKVMGVRIRRLSFLRCIRKISSSFEYHNCHFLHESFWEFSGKTSYHLWLSMPSSNILNLAPWGVSQDSRSLGEFKEKKTR